jgi:simple sugar transport system permease protein
MTATRLKDAAVSLRQPLLAVALTLVIGFVIVALVSDRPVAAYYELLLGNFSSPQALGNLLNRTVPILLIGLGIVFAFRGGVFNVGGEGQLYLGAISAAAVGLALPSLPGLVLIPLCLLVGVLAGAVWGWIPGVLKVNLGIDEVVVTLMLNFIALLLTGYLVAGPLRDPTAYGATSERLPEQSALATIPGLPGVNIGFLIAIALVPLAWLVLFRTTWGADLRAAGTNLRFAETVGVNAKRNVIYGMMLSGGLAGLAGGIYVLGIGHRFEQNFSPEFGLIGLTVALLARTHPVGVVFASIFYAMMINGSALMQIETSVPRSLVDLLTGVLVLIMTVEIRRRHRRRTEVAR